MIVVSNASPLVGLASIRQLDLLRQLYSEVHIPEAVWQEVVVDGAGQPGSTEIENAEWIKRRQVANTQLVHSLLQYLDEEAKHKGLIDEVKRYLDELRNVFGFRISEGLYRRVLTDEGEWR